MALPAIRRVETKEMVGVGGNLRSLVTQRVEDQEHRQPAGQDQEDDQPGVARGHAGHGLSGRRFRTFVEIFSVARTFPCRNDSSAMAKTEARMSPRMRPVGRSSNLRATRTFPSIEPSTIRFSAVMSPRTDPGGSTTTDPDVRTVPSPRPPRPLFSF